jgi:hypothetical protein
MIVIMREGRWGCWVVGGVQSRASGAEAHLKTNRNAGPAAGAFQIKSRAGIHVEDKEDGTDNGNT